MVVGMVMIRGIGNMIMASDFAITEKCSSWRTRWPLGGHGSGIGMTLGDETHAGRTAWFS